MATASAVRHASVTAFNDLTAFTAISLLSFRSPASTNRGIICKGNTSTTGWAFVSNNRQLKFTWRRTTTDLLYLTTKQFSYNTWYWLVAGVDQAGSATDLVRFFYARLPAVGQPVRLIPITVTTPTDGVDAYLTDAGSQVYAGALSTSVGSLASSMAYASLHAGRLSAGQIATIISDPRRYAGTSLFTWMLGAGGRTRVQDVSGKRRHGTINSTVVTAAGPPWSPWTASDEAAVDAIAPVTPGVGGGVSLLGLWDPITALTDAGLVV